MFNPLKDCSAVSKRHHDAKFILGQGNETFYSVVFGSFFLANLRRNTVVYFFMGVDHCVKCLSGGLLSIVAGYGSYGFSILKVTDEKIARSESGSASLRYGPPDPDPNQNFSDPQQSTLLLSLTYSVSSLQQSNIKITCDPGLQDWWGTRENWSRLRVPWWRQVILPCILYRS